MKRTFRVNDFPFRAPSWFDGEYENKKKETRNTLNNCRKSKLPEDRIAYCQHRREHKSMQQEKLDVHERELLNTALDPSSLKDSDKF